MIQYAQGLAQVLQQAGGHIAPPNPRQQPDRSLDLARLNATISLFVNASVALKAEAETTANAMNMKRMMGGLSEVDVLQLRGLNDRLMLVERAFILPEGLPGETWYKHVISSPSMTNSYAGGSYPGVTDAIANGEWRMAQRQLDALCHLINRASDGMRPPIPYQY